MFDLAATRCGFRKGGSVCPPKMLTSDRCTQIATNVLHPRKFADSHINQIDLVFCRLDLIFI